MAMPGEREEGRGGVVEARRGMEGWLSGCFAFLARAEHLRCKILNPGASAISPTFSARRRVERKERKRKRGRE